MAKPIAKFSYRWVYPDAATISPLNKFKPMNSKQQAAAVKAQQKSQKDASDSEFKQRARFQALETAERLNPNKIQNFAIAKGNKKEVVYDIAKEAEKIYQWLVKVLK
jgi:hypothetical protein